MIVGGVKPKFGQHTPATNAHTHAHRKRSISMGMDTSTPQLKVFDVKCVLKIDFNENKIKIVNIT